MPEDLRVAGVEDAVDRDCYVCKWGLSGYPHARAGVA
jgi:hypothetical protein